MNLETSITDSRFEWPNKVFHFKLDPRFSPTLLNSNVNHVSLANNHIMDFSSKGMFETMKILDSLRISHCGCGSNIKEAQRFTTFNIPNSNITIKCFSAADHETLWEASTFKEGIWIIDIDNEDYSDVLEIIRNSKKPNDLIIFSCHWGPNYSWEPSKNIQKFAHALIDAGVDIIHGHSAHHVQRIEKYQKGIIFYSLGDFLDDYAIDREYRNDLGCLVELDYEENKNLKSMKIHPTKISNLHVNLATNPIEINSVLKIMTRNL